MWYLVIYLDFSDKWGCYLTHYLKDPVMPFTGTPFCLSYKSHLIYILALPSNCILQNKKPGRPLSCLLLASVNNKINQYWTKIDYLQRQTKLAALQNVKWQHGVIFIYWFRVSRFSRDVIWPPINNKGQHVWGT